MFATHLYQADGCWNEAMCVALSKGPLTLLFGFGEMFRATEKSCQTACSELQALVCICVFHLCPSCPFTAPHCALASSWSVRIPSLFSTSDSGDLFNSWMSSSVTLEKYVPPFNKLDPSRKKRAESHLVLFADVFSIWEPFCIWQDGIFEH